MTTGQDMSEYDQLLYHLYRSKTYSDELERYVTQKQGHAKLTFSCVAIQCHAEINNNNNSQALPECKQHNERFVFLPKRVKAFGQIDAYWGILSLCLGLCFL